MTSTEVAVHANGAEVATYDPKKGDIVVPTLIEGVRLTFRPDQRTLDETQMPVLAPLGMKANWDPHQVAVFLMECQARGLNPWNREAYLMQYKDKRADEGVRYVRHIGIDGFRKRGESTGQYRGRIGPYWCDTDGQWMEIWPHKDRAPVAAKVGLNRAGFDAPVWAVAMYDEYVATKPVWVNGQRTDQREIIDQWRPAVQGGKPAIMLAKCAEAQAWRATFPERFGGFYAPEEFDRQKAETRAENTAAATKRREAYNAAQQAVGGAVVEGEVVEDTTADSAGAQGPVWGEKERELLLAELDEQAEVLGKTRTQLCDRWSAARGGRPIKDATADELAAHVHAIRPYVVEALRDQNRDDEARRYGDAPPVGDCRALFGRGPAVPAGPAGPAADTDETDEDTEMAK